MSNPYTTQSISGYNQSPPEDDGSQVSTNEIKWSTHKTKLGDPLKNLAEAINTETLAAFGLTFGQTISTHSSPYTVVAADRGKFLSVTGTTTITLIAVASAGDGFPLAIINTGTGVVTVDGSGAETINGAATVTLNPGNSILLNTQGTSWVGMIGLGDQSIKTVGVASAVNEITVTNSATGNAVDISATGTDANIDINLTPKGNGRVIMPKPSFSVHRNGTDQTNITSIDKIEWTTEEFDTNGDFDNATNFRFTPTVPGKYLLSASIYWTGLTALDVCIIYIYKNGSEYKRNVLPSATTTMSQNVTAVVDANGTTDYFEVFANNVNRDTASLTGTSTHTYFTGCKID